MTKTRLFGLLALGGLAALVSCDNGQGPTAGQLDANDCPFGTFRPMGLTECVFPANDLNGLEIGVSDNRCAAGQPAIPPQCVSDAGLRAYLSTSDKCAPGYRFLEGSCERGVNTGIGGSVGDTGFGTGVGGAAGTIAAGGSGVCPNGLVNEGGFCQPCGGCAGSPEGAAGTISGPGTAGETAGTGTAGAAGGSGSGGAGGSAP